MPSPVLPLLAALLLGGSGAPVPAALPAPSHVLLGFPTGFRVGGQPATAAQLRGRVLRLAGRTGETWTFAVTGLPPVTYRSAALPPGLDPLAPEDAELRTLRQRYEGKRVYPRSTLGCVPAAQIGLNFRDEARQGVKVLNVLRLNREQDVETRGFPGGGPFVKVQRPLALVFASQPGLRFSSGGGSGNEAELMRLVAQGARPPECARLSGVYEGAQALERLFSLTPPPASIRGVNPAGSLIGRTAEEALWLQGVPDLTPGTPEELYRLGEWRYSNLPGLGDGVLRFREGRVVEEVWPRLP